MYFTAEGWKHIEVFLAGSTALGIVAHAVNTFPTPTSKYGAWLLGLVQFIVGQRVSAKNTLNGADSVVTAVPKPDK